MGIRSKLGERTCSRTVRHCTRRRQIARHFVCGEISRSQLKTRHRDDTFYRVSRAHVSKNVAALGHALGSLPRTCTSHIHRHAYVGPDPPRARELQLMKHVVTCALRARRRRAACGRAGSILNLWRLFAACQLFLVSYFTIM
jgi:hypothetical protein